MAIYVLAGVNGAGKSSIGGAMFRARNADYFNPDEVARKILTLHRGGPKTRKMEGCGPSHPRRQEPERQRRSELRASQPAALQTETFGTASGQTDLADANAKAWALGKSLLEKAIAQRGNFAFETTLGGRTITSLLAGAASSGCEVFVWYAGLASVGLHLARVRARVKSGGHDIPEADIRRRWSHSRENLIRLLPVLAGLRLFDNSAEADPRKGRAPRPALVLEMDRGKITGPNDLAATPDWAKPIVAAAFKMKSRS